MKLTEFVKSSLARVTDFEVLTCIKGGAWNCVPHLEYKRSSKQTPRTPQIVV